MSLSRHFSTAALSTAALLSAVLNTVPRLHGAEIIKANNATQISQTGSWVGGVLPTINDTAVINSTFTETAQFGTGPSGHTTTKYFGLRLEGFIATTPNHVVISNTANANYVGIGAGGINIANGNRNLTIANLNVFADQTWNVGSNTLILGGTFLRSLDHTVVATSAASIPVSVNVIGTGGQLTLGNNNALAGGLVLTGVRLNANNVNSLGPNSGINNTINDTAQANLTGANLTYNGSLTIAGNGWSGDAQSLGAVRFQNGATLGGNLTLAGDALISAYNNTGAISGNILDNGSAHTLRIGAVNDTGVLTLSGLVDHSGVTSITGGTVKLGTSEVFANSSKVAIDGGIFDLNGFTNTIDTLSIINGTLTNSVNSAAITATTYDARGGNINARLTGEESKLIKTTSGTTTINVAQTYQGGTEINEGTLKFGAANVLVATSEVKLNGGTLDINGHHNQIGSLILENGSVINSADAAVLTSSSYDVRNGTILALIGGPGSTLTKSTAGTVILSAANNYTGLTSINAGTLVVSTAHAGGGAFTLANGASLGVALSPADSTLETSILTLNGGSIDFDLGALPNPGSALIDADQITLNALTTFNISSSGLSVGQFALLHYDAFTGSFSNFALNSLPARTLAELVNNTGSKTIDLKVLGIDLARWNGNLSGDWDTTTQNWRLASNASTVTTYLQGAGGTDSVLFNDLATGTRNVNLVGALTPSGVTVDTNNSYEFSGAGRLSGGGVLVKQGTGILSLTGTGVNDFTGGLIIENGIVRIGDGTTNGAGHAGAGTIQLATPGTIEFVLAAGDDRTISNPINGSGTYAQKGANQITLNGNNQNFSGLFLITSGILKPTTLNSLGTADIKAQSGGSLDVNGQPITNDIELDGGVILTTGGATNELYSQVTLSNVGGIVNTLNASTLSINQIISGTGGLTKVGDGVLQLLGANNYQGITTLSAGTIRLANNSALGAAGATNRTVINSNATLDLAGTLVAETLELNGGKLANSVGNATSSAAVILTGVSNVIETATGTGIGLSGDVTGAGSISKQGAGRLVLSGNNSFTGGTLVNTGTVVFQNPSALPATGLVTAAAGTTIGFGYSVDNNTISRIAPSTSTFTIAIGADSSSAFDFSNHPNASLGSIGNVTFSGSLITSAPNFLFGGGDGQLTVASNLTGPKGLTVHAANGSVVLTGNNNHTGTNTVSSGTLKLGSTNALGSASNALALQYTAGFTTTLDLNGNNVNVGALNAPQNPAGLVQITDNSAGSGTTRLTVNVAQGSLDSTYGSWIRDGASKKLAVVKTGAGTLIFNGRGSSIGEHTFSGGVYINQGTFDFRINQFDATAQDSDVIFTGSSTLLANNNGNVDATATGAYFQSVHFQDGIGRVVLARNNNGVNSANGALGIDGTLNRTIGAAGNLDLAISAGSSYKFIIGGVNEGEGTHQLLNVGIYFDGANFLALQEPEVGTALTARALQYTPVGESFADNNTADVNLAADAATLGEDISGTDLQLRGTGNVTGQGSESLNTIKIASSNSIALQDGATFSVNSILKTGGVPYVPGDAAAVPAILPIPAIPSNSTISGGAGITASDPALDFIVRTNELADTLTINSKILSSVQKGITKSGLGVLVLNADNDYTGITNILEGVIKIGNIGALGATGNTHRTRVHAYGLLDINGYTITAADEEVELINGGGLANSDTLNPSIFNGTLILSGDAQFHPYAGAVLNIESVLQGAGILTQTGLGRTYFKADNTFTGDIHITAGSLAISRIQQLGTGPKTIRVAGNGLSTLQPELAAVLPQFEIDGSAGDLVFDNTIGFQLSSDAGAAIPAGVVNVAGSNTINGRISLINGGGGQGRLYVQGGQLTVNGNIDAQEATGNRTLMIGGTAAGQGVLNGTISDTVVDATATRVVSVAKDGLGTWTLNGTNTYTGNLSVLDGTLRVGNIAATGSSTAGTVVLGTTATIGTQAIFEYIGNLDALLQRQITASAGTSQAVIRNSSGHLLTLAGAIARNTRTVSFEQGNILVTGAITGNNAASHTIIDGSSVTFTNIGNNYGGSTTIKNGGILKNGATNVLPNSTTIILGDAANNSTGTYDLNGFDETVAAVTHEGTGSAVVTNSGITAVTSVLTVNGAGSFNGLIQDGAVAKTALTKSTGGIFTLAGNHTYTGPTNVTGGTLAIAATGQLASNVTVASAATLDVLGEINGTVQVSNGGILRIGNTVTGLATLDSTLTLSDTSHVHFDIGGANRGAATSGYDAINELDALTLDGTFHVTVTDLLNFVAGQTYQFQLIDWTNLLTPGSVVNNGYNFDFSAADVSSLGLSWITDSFHINGTISLAVVPEPARAALLLIGLISLGLRRRRSISVIQPMTHT